MARQTQASQILMARSDQVIAFRLDSHHLATCLPPGSLLAAAGVCGVQDTPPGSAALALHARVTYLTPADIDHALAVDKTLLHVWSMRAAPIVIPTSDVAIFTHGLLPEDEASTRFFILGAERALDQVGISATQVVELTATALQDALDGRALTKQQLGVELATRVSRRLTAHQLAAWQLPSWYAPNQRLGEAIVRFALGVIALQGAFCLVPRQANATRFIRTDQWLGTPPPRANRQQARPELVRRYLHGYGPSTIDHFAAWAGIAPDQAASAWKLVQRELVKVDFNGRETITTNKALQRHLWRAAGNPGIVLAGGQFVATWRSQKKSKRLHVTVELPAPISPRTRAEIETEAATLAPFKDCSSVELAFSTLSLRTST